MSEKRFCPPQPLRFWITPAYAGKSCAEQARRFHLRDHPPRMRGKGASGIVCDFVHGITPTCAGKSPAIMVCSLEYWGSPPRVWGKVQPERDVQDAARITPAYAGKSKRMRFPRTGSKDHPRVCGEKTAYQAQAGCNQGSPPRMRGKVTGNLYAGRHLRITPAYAGKRIAELQTPAVSWDHPRVCGEKLSGCVWLRVYGGSPPRMRGKACLKRPSGPGLRITPAYAGKSAGMACNGQIRQDHPRVCGEKVDGGRNRSRQMGSPPRMRGKACVACASAAPGWDHPRVCGEKNDWQRIKEAYTGSPPRMRGKEKFAMAADMKLGITPAYAGKRSFRC